MSSLDIWYIKAVEFERARRSAEEIFGQRRQFIEEKRIMREEIKREDRLDLVVPR